MTSVWQKRTLQFYSVILVLLTSMPFLQGKEYHAPLSLPGVAVSYSLCMILCNIGTVVIAIRAFRDILADETASLWATALYSLSVYRIYSMCIAGDIKGTLVMMVVPGIVAGIYKIWNSIWTGIRKADGMTLVSFFLCLFFFLILQKDIFVNWRNPEMRELISGQRIQGKGLLFPQMAFHCWKYTGLQPGEGMQYSAPIGVGMILIFGLVLFLILWLFHPISCDDKEMEQEKLSGIAKSSAVFAILCLLLSWKAFPWDFLQQRNGTLAYLVGTICKPHVFLRYGTFFLAVVWGNILMFLKGKKNSFFYRLATVILLAGIVTSGIFLMDHIGTYQEPYCIETQQE